MAQNDPTLDDLIIQTGGQRLEGWLNTQVIRGLELTPSNFSISLTERFPNSFNEAVVVPGSTCQVYLGGDLILTGYIDQYLPSYDARTHFVRISGRSNTEDIVDSSFLAEQSTDWQIAQGTMLKQAVKKILEKFANVGLSMSEADDVAIPRPYQITPGETVWSVIETLCRMCSRLLWDDQNGNLVIGQVTTSDRAGSSLVEGQNVEAAVARIDWSGRFNKFMVINSSQTSGSLNVSTFATAVDDQIRNTRIKLIVMDADLGPDQEFAKKRAYWMMNRMKGRSEIVEVHVTGWRDGRGKLWTPNTIVSVQLPTLKVKADLVIAQCQWQRDENGTRTILTCMPAAALQPEPYIAPFALGQGHNE